MERKKSPAAPRDKHMEEAVCVAAELFLKNGIEDVKMTDVADACGLGVASLYRYFGTKNVLVIRAGAMLWRDVRALYADHFDPVVMAPLPGLGRIRLLFSLFEELYRDHRDFIAFIGELDAFLSAGDLPAAELDRYGESLFDFYGMFRAAFEKGVLDGTVRGDADPDLFYRAVTHAATALELKLIRGALLPGDKLDDPGELHLLLEMALAYLAPA